MEHSQPSPRECHASFAELIYQLRNGHSPSDRSAFLRNFQLTSRCDHVRDSSQLRDKFQQHVSFYDPTGGSWERIISGTENDKDVKFATGATWHYSRETLVHLMRGLPLLQQFRLQLSDVRHARFIYGPDNPTLDAMRRGQFWWW